uniref:Uncharacterized protein n=1 Tax=Salmonella sp. TaxID=599 RepID=A0A482EUB5_SALSP|nr:hypothetical protein NNIBIDOC_00084 [Salmonella sp.]
MGSSATSDSLKLIKTVLPTYSISTRSVTAVKVTGLRVIREASNLSVDKGDQLQIPSHRVHLAHGRNTYTRR